MGLIHRRAILDMAGNIDDLGGASRGEIAAHQVDARRVPLAQGDIGDEDVDAIVRGHERLEGGNAGYDIDVEPRPAGVFGQHAAKHLLVLLVVL